MNEQGYIRTSVAHSFLRLLLLRLPRSCLTFVVRLATFVVRLAVCPPFLSFVVRSRSAACPAPRLVDLRSMWPVSRPRSADQLPRGRPSASSSASSSVSFLLRAVVRQLTSSVVCQLLLRAVAGDFARRCHHPRHPKMGQEERKSGTSYLNRNEAAHVEKIVTTFLKSGVVAS